MPDLSFTIDGMEAVLDSAAPKLNTRVRIRNACAGERVNSIALRCQTNIEPARRTYNAKEKALLQNVFGSLDQWHSTVRPLVWTSTQIAVPGFTGSSIVDMPIACSFDLNIRAANYLDAVCEGEIPLSFLFSGTVFYEANDAPVQIVQIPWDREATFRLPVGMYKEVIASPDQISDWAALNQLVRERVERCRSAATGASNVSKNE